MINTLTTFGSNKDSCFTTFLYFTTSVCIISFHSACRIKYKMNSLANWQEQGNWDRSDEAGVGEWNMVTLWQEETNGKMTWMREEGNQHNFPTKHYCSMQSKRQKTAARRGVTAWLQVSHPSNCPPYILGHRYSSILLPAQAIQVWLSTYNEFSSSNEKLFSPSRDQIKLSRRALL